MTLLAVTLAVLTFAACGEGDGEVDQVDANGTGLAGETATVLPTGLAQRPGAPRDVASPPPETITPPAGLQLQTQLEQAVEELRGAITDVQLELDHLTLQTNLEETASDRAEQACQAALDLEDLSEIQEITVTGPDGSTLATCTR